MTTIASNLNRLSTERLRTTLVFLANGFGIGVWSIEIAEIKLQAGVSGGQMGAALFVLAVSALASMTVTPKALTRLPAARVCAVSGVAFLLALVLPALAHGFLGLCLALAVLGFANGGLDVAMNSRASVIEADYPAPIMSSFHAAFSLGGMVGAGFAGAWVSQGAPPIAVLALAALVGLLPMVLGVMGNSSAPSNTAESIETPGTAPARTRLNAALVAICAISFCALLTEGALADWTSIYLADVIGSAFAVGFIAFSAGMFIGRLMGDRLVARLGRRLVGVAGVLAASAALMVVLIGPSTATAAIGFSVIGLGLANIVPIAFSMAGMAAASRPAGIALAATTGYTGLLFGPALIGGLTHVFTLAQTLWLLVATTLIMALLGTRAFRPSIQASACQSQPRPTIVE